MSPRLRLGAAVALALAAPARAESVDRIFADYDAAAAHADEESAPTWPDVTPAGVARRKAALVAFQKRLAAVPAAGLSEEQRISRQLLDRKIAVQLEGFGFDEERMPFRSGEGFFDAPGGAAANTVIRSSAEAEAWLARMAAVPDFYAANIANMRRGLASGFTQSRPITEIALKAVRAAAAIPVADDPLLKPFAHMPAAIPAAEQARLRARADDLIATKVKPARAALLDFMEREYLPKARATLGARQLPNGDAYYRFLVRRNTTTDLTPEQVHALGLAEVARIRGEMAALIARAGFKGSVADYIAAIRADPANYATSVQQYREKVSEAGKRADEALPLWFGKLPRLTWGVYVKRPDEENSSGGYSPGNAKAGVAGHITLSRANATTSPLYSMPSWTFHEGVPGHHLQIALAQENDVPAFRRKDDVTAFVEGWALYTERLADEMGLYRDDKERFGKLSWEIWRACRLVMDTGIHWMGWSEAQAKTCLTENSALAPAEIAYEIDRYTGWPGQALAYKIGEIRIRAIRARAEKALGPKFDIRRFHDALIDDGAMPMDMLDRRMDAWIAGGGR